MSMSLTCLREICSWIAFPNGRTQGDASCSNQHNYEDPCPSIPLYATKSPYLEANDISYPAIYFSFAVYYYSQSRLLQNCRFLLGLKVENGQGLQEYII